MPEDHVISGSTSKFLRYTGNRKTKSDLEGKMKEFFKQGNHIVLEGKKVCVKSFPVGGKMVGIYPESGSRISWVSNRCSSKPKQRFTSTSPDDLRILVETNGVLYNVSYKNPYDQEQQ